MDICAQKAPTWQEAKPNHFVACHLYNENGPKVKIQGQTGNDKDFSVV